MKSVIALLSLLVALALVSAAGATPHKITKIAATLVGEGCGAVTGTECGSGGGGSCVCESDFWQFAGSTNNSPPLGSLTFWAEYTNGYFCPLIGSNFDCLEPIVYTESLELKLAAPNGDQLVLGGENHSETALFPFAFDAPPVSGTWTVGNPGASTGRFARYSGSGTYTISASLQGETPTFTLVLTGSLTFQ
jgi:hypothetical protein